MSHVQQLLEIYNLEKGKYLLQRKKKMKHNSQFDFVRMNIEFCYNRLLQYPSELCAIWTLVQIRN